MIKKLVTILCFMLLAACSEQQLTESSTQPTEISLQSYDELQLFFEKQHYTLKAWESGNREVPRITFSGISEHWQENSQKMPVETKKRIFLRMMLPLILLANENILAERKTIKTSSLTASALVNIAIKYRLIKDKNTPLTDQLITALLTQVDIIPPSLALAQTVEESGWGTSRFAHEGNAFFGQWDFSGNGIKPKQQRKALGNYGIARFDSPLASVEGYMLNINRASAYSALRTLRAQQRSKNKSSSGVLLAGTLIKYSERGEAYIKGLRALMAYNHLDQADTAYLSTKPAIHIVTTKK
ncbi:glucosaminidase domain-containing protein [Psychromonas hadalis]|uniref:glucosaminidase domain-containing protein n=1 Tax=Psychromonas hadalis TaxID=211669 RepID=UPI0003B565E5|nr:glucosaminidase domain-containing protein [Psychromonas hadalis]